MDLFNDSFEDALEASNFLNLPELPAEEPVPDSKSISSFNGSLFSSFNSFTGTIQHDSSSQPSAVSM